jgi:hypothetical protein
MTRRVNHYIKSTQYYTLCKHFCSVYFTGVLIIITSNVPALLTSSAQTPFSKLRKHNTTLNRQYVEIKCQLDATDDFLLQILLLAQHVSGTIMPIIRSSKVLYKWFLPVVFGAVKMEIRQAETTCIILSSS